MGEERKMYRVFCGKGRRKEKTWKTKASMGGGIRMDFREIGWGCRVDSVGSE
jgi:hypothetical protein